MSNLDQKIFGKKKFSSLFQEIYDNQKKKEGQISSLIQELKPLIKEYMELGIKNDEQLIKMATIIQRALNTGKESEEDFGLSEDEKKQLFKEIENFNTKPPKKLR